MWTEIFPWACQKCAKLLVKAQPSLDTMHPSVAGFINICDMFIQLNQRCTHVKKRAQKIKWGEN